MKYHDVSHENSDPHLDSFPWIVGGSLRGPHMAHHGSKRPETQDFTYSFVTSEDCFPISFA